MVCRELLRTVANCIKYFNDQCSEDFLQTGKPSFTYATLREPAVPALTKFALETWVLDKALRGGLKKTDIHKCTVFGGTCEHPAAVEQCRDNRAVKRSIPKHLVLALLIIPIWAS